MTLIWLLVWVCSSTPTIRTWNSWLIALLVCVFLDLLAVARKEL